MLYLLWLHILLLIFKCEHKKWQLEYMTDLYTMPTHTELLRSQTVYTTHQVVKTIFFKSQRVTKQVKTIVF